MFVKQFIFLLICFLFSIGCSQGQTVFRPPIEHFTPKQYGQLQTPENWAAAEDGLGRMYFGNANGVLEYDGESWDFVKVKDGAFVSALAQDKNGHVFVGTEGEFGYIHSLANGKVEYRSLLPLLSEDTIDFGIVWRIFSTPLGVYFQSEAAIFYFDYEKVTALMPETSFHLSFQSEGEIYVRQREKGIFRVRGIKLERVFSSFEVNEEGVFGWYKHGDSFSALIFEKGFFRFAKNGEVMNAYSEDYYTDSRLTFSVELHDKNIAVATADRGVLIVNKNGKLLKRLTQSNGLNGEHVKSIYQDKRGNLWLAMETGIAWVNYTSPIHIFDKNSGIEGSVECFITTPKGHRLCGTSAGVFQLNENTNHFHKGGSTSGVWQLFNRGNSTYACTEMGIFEILENGVNRVSRIPMSHIFQPNTGKAMLGAGPHGLYWFDEGFNVIKTIPLSINRVSGILQDGDVYWIGTLGQGAIRVQMVFDKAKGVTTRGSLVEFYSLLNWKIDIYTAFDGLNDEWVKPVKFQNRTVFLTLKGLQQFVHEDEVAQFLPDSLKGNPDFERGYFDIFSLENQDINEPVTVLKKHEKNVWICLNNKMFYFPEKRYEEKVFRPFLGYDLSRINELYLDDKGVWICAAEGVVYYEAKKQANINFKSLIRRVVTGRDSVLNFHPHSEDFSFMPFSQEFSVEPLVYKLNSMVFSFAALCVENGFEPEYSYLLEGHDEDWSEWGKTPEVRFTNLHEGEYVFRVKARNVYGDESDEAILHFSILPPWYRTASAYLGYVLVFVILLIVASRISAKRLKAQNKRLESIVEERTREVVKQKDALKKQNDQISHQKKEITDSISYAYRIQEAILPLGESIKKYFPESFVLYKPKDIVSGDFYWFSHLNDISIIVCADCTGHGVPGGFMSMIGSDKLNHTVLEKGILQPGEILRQVNIGVKRSLKQEDEENLTTKDGMDVAICAYNHKTGELSYAGANRSLWVVRNPAAESAILEEYKPTKMAIGGFTTEETIFEETTIHVQSGDIFYMSTDGFADQFGGPKGKKMMVKRMKEEVLMIRTLSMEDQKEKMDVVFESWKNHTDEEGNTYEQVDDVCVIGVRL